MRASEKLRRVLDRLGISQAELAEAAGMEPTSLSYCLTDSGFKGEYLPREKPWSKPLMEAMIAKGTPSKDVADLFGIAIAQAPRLSDMEEIKSLLKQVLSEISHLNRQLNQK